METKFAPRDTDGRKQRCIDARRSGATIQRAAEAAGVHIATVFRWQSADLEFADALRRAEREREAERVAAIPPMPPPKRPDPLLMMLRPGMTYRERPGVPWHPDCPACGADAEVRRGGRYWPYPTFWRCERWPRCEWVSWRPRCPDDCPACRKPMYWTHSRKHGRCPDCGHTEKRDAILRQFMAP